MSDAFAGAVPATEEQDERQEWLIAWAVVLLLLAANANRPLTPKQRKRARDLLRTQFEQDVTRQAQSVATGTQTPAAWQLAVAAILAAYMRQMAVAGAGTMPAATVQQAVSEEMQRQAPFLDGFAAAVAQGGLSIPQMASRAKLYGKAAWGIFYLAQGSTAGDGIVERWVTRDDKFVCRVCAPRHGRYFLPGEGPMPGTDCLGSCRCERVQEPNPQIYARLTGQRRAA